MKQKEIPLSLALVPVLFTIAALYIALVHYAALELTAHMPLVFGIIVASLIAIKRGYRWADIESFITKGISHALGACLILLAIGPLIGSWIDSGIVPAMINYGLDLLSPSIFLSATVIICALVSLSTGSSWSTAATVGIALMGVGEGLGIPRHIVAGAIISGSYFGDKMSPLSDTTNLAPAMAGSSLFEHIRHMVFTSGPSIILTLIIFAFISGRNANADPTTIQTIKDSLNTHFALTPWLLIPPLLIIAMVVFKIPALPAIIGGWLLGVILSFVAQGRGLGQILKVAFSGVHAKTGNPAVDKLLNRGGLSSMFKTVILIMLAMSFGGVLEGTTMLDTIATAILSLAKSDGALIFSTLLTSASMNILAADQYLAIVVPGRMFRSAYEKRNLAPKNLSRALEDSGTLTSVFIPWNTCGAYMTTTLNIAPWSYVPYTFFNILNPLISAFYGFTGITMTKAEQEKQAQNGATSEASQEDKDEDRD